MPGPAKHKPRVGVSHCLLGEPVRYDGGHKLHFLIDKLLGPHVQWLPVCPEVEMGLAVPREPLVLTVDAGSRKLIGKDSGKDYTGEMVEYCHRKTLELKAMGLDGFIFKQSSPSCGLTGVKVYPGGFSEGFNENGSGFFG